jgi:hypothetical protein
MPRSTGWNKAGWALALALLAVNVYRAATQSITTDEAFTFHSYVDAPLGDAVRHYDANNHVLYSALERASVALFGVSELSLRLPSLAGGALYLWAAMRVCFYAFGGGPLALVCLAVVAGNPLVLDFLSLARGYGMGLALLALGLYLLLRHTAEGRRGAPYGAAVALGLSVAANLIYLVPAAALAAVSGYLMLRERRAGGWELVDRFALPGFLAAFLWLALPLSRATADSYYFGARTPVETARGLAQALFLPVLEGHVRSPFQMVSFERLWLAAPVAAVLAAVAVWGAARALRLSDLGPRDACAALAGGGLALSLLLLAAAHVLWGVPYPQQRTGIYLVPLLAWGVFAAALSRAARIAAGVLALICVVQFALLLRVDHYGPWRDDAAVKRVMAQLRAREDGSRRVRVAASGSSNLTVWFYQRRYGWTWMDSFSLVQEPDSRADYYVLWKADEAAVAAKGLTVLYRDPLNGLMLAR